MDTVKQEGSDCIWIHFTFSNAYNLKTMQDINKSFDRMIDQFVSCFCDFLKEFFSTTRAFSEVVLLFFLSFLSFLSIKLFYMSFT